MNLASSEARIRAALDLLISEGFIPTRGTWGINVLGPELHPSLHPRPHKQCCGLGALVLSLAEGEDLDRRLELSLTREQLYSSMMVGRIVAEMELGWTRKESEDFTTGWDQGLRPTYRFNSAYRRLGHRLAREYVDREKHHDE